MLSTSVPADDATILGEGEWKCASSSPKVAFVLGEILDLLRRWSFRKTEKEQISPPLSEAPFGWMGNKWTPMSFFLGYLLSPLHTSKSFCRRKEKFDGSHFHSHGHYPMRKYEPTNSSIQAMATRISQAPLSSDETDRPTDIN